MFYTAIETMKPTDIDKLIQAMKAVFVTKDDIKGLEQRLNKLDAKQEFMDMKLDAFLGEIQDARDEQTILSEKSKDHTDQLESHDERIKVLEKRHSSSPSQVFPSV